MSCQIHIPDQVVMLTFCPFTFFQAYCFSDTVIKCVVVFAAMFVSFMVLSLPPVVHLEQSKCCRACLICRTTSTFQVSFGFILVIQYNLNIYLCRFTVLYRKSDNFRGMMILWLLLW